MSDNEDRDNEPLDETWHRCGDCQNDFRWPAMQEHPGYCPDCRAKLTITPEEREQLIDLFRLLDDGNGTIDRYPIINGLLVKFGCKSAKVAAPCSCWTLPHRPKCPRYVK